jgi:hypothetical protein
MGIPMGLWVPDGATVLSSHSNVEIQLDHVILVQYLQSKSALIAVLRPLFVPYACSRALGRSYDGRARTS